MAKTVKTRIQHKRETAANWASATSFKPMEGELIVYKPDNTGDPAMLKVGDGSTVAKDLPFIKAGSATTADSATKDGAGNTITSTYAKNADLTSHTGNTTVHITAAERTKWNNASTHASSTHAPTNAEKNQNAFSNIKVGSTTVAADTTTDTLELVGSNVTLTPDATNDKVTIGITKTNVTTALGYTPPTTDTKYTHPSTHPASMITGLATVATSGKYSDLSGRPTIPTIPSSLPANGGNADTVDSKHASDFATSAQGTKADNALPKSGGNLSGHIYLTGANASSSTGSTSQIVFGTSSNQHVAISSNTKAIVINPNTAETTNQIVLYLDKASQFPSGISGNLYGNASTATKFASSQSVALTGDVTGSASSQAGWSVATTLANSGVTAGSYGPSANASPAHGKTFSVPYITVDAKGRVTSASTKTITLPAVTTVNNATLTIQKNGTNVATFTANSATNATANITVPTKTSELTNDSGFITTGCTVTIKSWTSADM